MADRRVPSHDPRNHCRKNFGSSSLLVSKRCQYSCRQAHSNGHEKKKERKRDRVFTACEQVLHLSTTSGEVTRASNFESKWPAYNSRKSWEHSLQALTVGFGFTLACYNSCSLYYTFLFLDSGLRKLPLSSDEGWVC